MHRDGRTQAQIERQADASTDRKTDGHKRRQNYTDRQTRRFKIDAADVLLGAVAGGGGAAAAAAAPAEVVEEVKEEAKEEKADSDEESDDDMGFSLFD